MRRILKRLAAIEPVIGHMKQDHRIDLSYLIGVASDKINAIMAGVGFNLRMLLRWVDFGLNLMLIARPIGMSKAKLDSKKLGILPNLIFKLRCIWGREPKIHHKISNGQFFRYDYVISEFPSAIDLSQLFSITETISL